MANKGAHEPGYKPVLIREETKQKLQAFRRTVENRDLAQERRLATAALEYCLERPDVMKEVLRLVNQVVLKDIN